MKNFFFLIIFLSISAPSLLSLGGEYQRIRDTVYTIDLSQPVNIQIDIQNSFLLYPQKSFCLYFPELASKPTISSSINHAHSETITSLFQLRNTNLASCSWDGSIKIRDAHNGKLIQIFQAPNYHTEPSEILIGIELSDGSLAASLADGSIIFFNKNGSLQESIPCHHSGFVYSLSETPHQKIISTGEDGDIYIWDKESKVCAFLHSNTQKLTHLHNGFWATSCFDNSIKIWSYDYSRTPMFSTTHNAHIRPINMIIQRDNQDIVSCSDDGTVKVWEFLSMKRQINGTVKLNNASSMECKHVYLFDHPIEEVLELTNGNLFAKTCNDDFFVITSSHEYYRVNPQISTRKIIELIDGRLAAASEDADIIFFSFYSPAILRLSILQVMLLVQLKRNIPNRIKIHNDWLSIFYTLPQDIQNEFLITQAR